MNLRLFEHIHQSRCFYCLCLTKLDALQVRSFCSLPDLCAFGGVRAASSGGYFEVIYVRRGDVLDLVFTLLGILRAFNLHLAFDSLRN